MDAVADQLHLPSWYPIPDEWDMNSLYTAMCVSAYMDWSVINIDSGANAPLPAEGPVAAGAQIFQDYEDQIDRELTRAAVNDTIFQNGVQADPMSAWTDAMVAQAEDQFGDSFKNAPEFLKRIAVNAAYDAYIKEQPGYMDTAYADYTGTEENSQAVSDSAIAILDRYASGTIESNEELSQDTQFRDLVYDSLTTDGQFVFRGKVYTGNYIFANSDLGKELVAAGIADPDGFAKVEGKDVIVINGKTDDNYNWSWPKYMQLIEFLSDRYKQFSSDPTGLQSVLYLVTLGNAYREKIEGRDEQELTSEETAFFEKLRRMAFERMYAKSEELQKEARETTAFAQSSKAATMSLFKPVVSVLNSISTGLGLNEYGIDYADEMNQSIQESLELLRNTPEYKPWMGVASSALNSVAAMAGSAVVGMGISSALGGLSELVGTSIVTDSTLLANPALQNTGILSKLAPNDLLKGMLVTQFDESYRKYKGATDSESTAVVSAMLEAIGMTYIEGLGGIGAASGESMAAGIAKADKGVLKKIWAGITGASENMVEEMGEEAVQAFLQSTMEGVTTGQTDMTGNMQQFELKNAGSTAASIAITTLLFYLIGLPAEIGNAKYQTQAQSLLNEFAAAFRKGDTALLNRLGLEAYALANKAAGSLPQNEAQTVRTFGERLADEDGKREEGAAAIQEESSSELLHPETKNGEISAPKLTDARAIAETDTSAMEKVLTKALSTLEALGVDTTEANSAYFDYLTANAETKAAALNNAVNAINTTMENAISAQQAVGADTSALTALKAQLNSTLNAAIQMQTGVSTQTNPAVTEQTMTNTISTLLKLPANLQTQANVEAARQAYFDYLTASSATPGAKAAAYDKAVKLLGESAEIALENPSLDAGTRAALETLLDNIDSGRSVGDNRSEFRYEHNPMDNPKAAKDIVENPNAVYGYSPNPKSDRIGKFAEFDWTNKDVVSRAREARMQYHNDNAAIYNLVKEMQRNGATIEEIAKAANQQRNLNRLQIYIDTGNMVGYKMAVESNMRNFNNEIGMTAEQAYDKYKSWDAVLEKAMSANAGMDACCGLYDEFYYLY